VRWCEHVRDGADDIDACIREAATLGREVAAAFLICEGTVCLIFRPIPRGGSAHVVATLVDRNGYPR